MVLNPEVSGSSGWSQENFLLENVETFVKVDNFLMIPCKELSIDPET